MHHVLGVVSLSLSLSGGGMSYFIAWAGMCEATNLPLAGITRQRYYFHVAASLLSICWNITTVVPAEVLHE